MIDLREGMNMVGKKKRKGRKEKGNLGIDGIEGKRIGIS